MIKLPFSEMLAYMGASHHWPMDGTDPLNQEVLDGPGNLSVSLSDNHTLHTQDAELFEHTPNRYVRCESGDYPHWTIGNISSHVTDQGLTDWSVIFFAGSIGDTMAIFRSNVGGGDLQTTFSSVFTFPPGTMFALVFDAAAGTYTVYVGTNVERTLSGQSTDLGTLNLLTTFDQTVVGHIAFFSTALTADDLATIRTQRLFTGTIEGTATVDGNGAPAMIRAITRLGGHLSGETTAAADGTYKLWVTDPAEVDLLAIPPDGVAARPLAHGPILPTSAG